MGDVELVIKIPEEYYKIIKTQETYIEEVGRILQDSAKKGIPFPEPHGKIADLNDLWDAYHDVDCDFYEAIDVVKPLIEATEEKE